MRQDDNRALVVAVSEERTPSAMRTDAQEEDYYEVSTTTTNPASPLSSPPLPEDSLPPPMDDVTICSEDESFSFSYGEESSSSSPIGTTDPTASPNSRSLFSKYWERHGGNRPQLQRPTHSSPPSYRRSHFCTSPTSRELESPAVGTIHEQGVSGATAATVDARSSDYPHFPSPNDDDDDADDENAVKHPPAVRRRSIFGGSSSQWQSSPSLVSQSLSDGNAATTSSSLRKTQSTSALDEARRRRPPSCIRECPRYSGLASERQRQSPSSPSPRGGGDSTTTTAVSFCNMVKVQSFEPVLETYASDDWSKWFA